jgi:hypothetical protein
MCQIELNLGHAEDARDRDDLLCIVKKVCSMKMTTQEQRAPQRDDLVWSDNRFLFERYAELVQ